jgi:hypothetical protein
MPVDCLNGCCTPSVFTPHASGRALCICLHSAGLTMMLTPHSAYGYSVYKQSRYVALSPRSTEPLENLTYPQPCNKFHAFYGTRRFSNISLEPATCPLSSARLIKSTHSLSYLLKVHFNITFPSIRRCPSGIFSFSFPLQDTVKISRLFYTFHLPSPSHPASFVHPNNIL